MQFHSIPHAGDHAVGVQNIDANHQIPHATDHVVGVQNIEPLRRVFGHGESYYILYYIRKCLMQIPLIAHAGDHAVGIQDIEANQQIPHATDHAVGVQNIEPLRLGFRAWGIKSYGFNLL